MIRENRARFLSVTPPNQEIALLGELIGDSISIANASLAAIREFARSVFTPSHSPRHYSSIAISGLDYHHHCQYTIGMSSFPSILAPHPNHYSF